MDLKGAKVLVVGGGLSGEAAAAKLLKMEADVYLTDMKPLDKLPGVARLGLDPSHLILEREPDIEQLGLELLVLSPGVPPALPYIQNAVRLGIPLWSEVELALKDAAACIIGITGSNGKTTTTSLLGRLAAATGRPAVVAGNIGLALSGLTEHLDEQSIIVAELSSFQLEYIHDFKAHIACVLNLTPDHLDRHGTMENYAAAKARILENQTEADLAVLNRDDPVIRGFAQKTRARVVFFSRAEMLADGICLEHNSIVLRRQGVSVPIVDRRELLIRGDHNVENAMAATAVALELGLKPEQIAAVLKAFEPVKHRQEIVGRYNDIVFINDSKGTNPDSSIKALQSYDEPIVLIAGGKNKGLDMTEFMLEAQKKVKSLILVGQAAPELEAKAREVGIGRIVRSDSFEDCVRKAIQEACPGDVVLLSPACTSWDMFKSYEERGELFKTLVRNHYSEPSF